MFYRIEKNTTYSLSMYIYLDIKIYKEISKEISSDIYSRKDCVFA